MNVIRQLSSGGCAAESRKWRRAGWRRDEDGERRTTAPSSHEYTERLLSFLVRRETEAALAGATGGLGKEGHGGGWDASVRARKQSGQTWDGRARDDTRPRTGRKVLKASLEETERKSSALSRASAARDVTDDGAVHGAR